MYALLVIAWFALSCVVAYVIAIVVGMTNMSWQGIGEMLKAGVTAFAITLLVGYLWVVPSISKAMGWL